MVLFSLGRTFAVNECLQFGSIFGGFLFILFFSSFMYTMLGGWEGAFGRALTFLTWLAHNWEEWYATWQSLPCTCRMIFIQDFFLVFLVAQFSYYLCYLYWVLKIDIDHLVCSGNIVGSNHSDQCYRLEWLNFVWWKTVSNRISDQHNSEGRCMRIGGLPLFLTCFL